MWYIEELKKGESQSLSSMNKKLKEIRIRITIGIHFMFVFALLILIPMFFLLKSATKLIACKM